MGDPIRTCVGCGARRPQREMLRFVRPEGSRAVVGRLVPGRGYYVCPQKACFERLGHRLRRRFSAAERRRVEEELNRELGRSSGNGLGDQAQI